MKFVFKVLLVSFVAAFTHFAYAQPVYLYDASGNVGAVIDSVDQTNVVYSASSGDAVGYVDNATGAVYSYSGRLLGWYSDGVLWDSNGYILAFVETSKPKNINVQLVKKEVTINRSQPVVVTTKQVVTTPPTYVYEVSPTPLNAILTVEPAN